MVRYVSIFKSSVLEPAAKKQTTQAEADLKTHKMRKSIFAYWAVFTERFVDNLHLRI